MTVTSLTSWILPRRRRGRPTSAVTVVAVTVLALLILAAVLAPILAPFDPIANDLAAAYQLPSWSHLLGTDQFGRDILSRLMYGGQVSLVGAAEATVVFAALGLTFGLLAGYYGGIVESIVSWFAEVAFALPQIIVILAVLSVLSNSTTAAMIVLGVMAAPALAVMIAGATKTVVAEPYIAAARVSGLRPVQLIVRHVLPQVVAPLIVQLSLFAGTALLFQTGLDFLGLGTQPPAPSWGAMISDGAGYLGRDPWMVLPPGIVIIVSVMSFALIGDALQDSRRERFSARAGRTVVSESQVAADVERTSLPVEGTILSVRGLSVRSTGSNPVSIIDNVSFDLQEGSCLGIVGESGCGKTMTAMSVMGLLPENVEVSAGAILFEGADLTAMTDVERAKTRGSGIALISQEPVANLDPSFTVGQQIVEVIRRHSAAGATAAKREMFALLEQVRLPDPERVARRYPHELSGGMAQRAMIAIALAANPRILIADEPTTALDVTVQAEILALLAELREKRGLAVVIVSHDWGVIADICDAAVVMYAGQIVEEAQIDDVFAQPRHPYSFGLMSSNPYYAKAPRTELHSISGAVPPVGEWSQGCRFAARCEFATTACSAEAITLDEVAAQHWSRCIRSSVLPELELEEQR